MARALPKGFSQLSGKHVAIDKANTQVIATAAIAAAVLVFALFASNALIKTIGYQNKVYSLRDEANQQLVSNIDSTALLTASYTAFNDAPESVTGTADKNSKIILDALPSQYDFPALATSLEAMIKNAGMTVGSIKGIDDELTAKQSAITPTPIAIPFDVSAKGDYAAVQRLIKDFERSIRPFKIFEFNISGEDKNLSITIVGETYYQPSKELGIEEATVSKDGSAKQASTSDTANTTTTDTGAN